eukprot:357693-Chlamydomonas_euryale.AAC.4
MGWRRGACRDVGPGSASWRLRMSRRRATCASPPGHACSARGSREVWRCGGADHPQEAAREDAGKVWRCGGADRRQEAVHEQAGEVWTCGPPAGSSM